jgi:hypothetical protein
VAGLRESLGMNAVGIHAAAPGFGGTAARNYG